MGRAWGPLIVGQLDNYWDALLWPRLLGLTDEEYFWEPVPGSWSLRRTDNGTYVMDNESPAPVPPPMTTIAWRMNHIAVGCFAQRAERFFDVPDNDPLPGTAEHALGFLRDTYHRWRDPIASLDEAAIAAPLGPRAGAYSQEPMGAMMLHINREVMHHGAEICLLRDIYRDKNKI